MIFNCRPVYIYGAKGFYEIFRIVHTSDMWGEVTMINSQC